MSGEWNLLSATVYLTRISLCQSFFAMCGDKWLTLQMTVNSFRNKLLTFQKWPYKEVM